MRRREFLTTLSTILAASRTRAGTAFAAIGPNLKWAVSIGLWNDQPPTPFTDMLDVLKDTGFDGFRRVYLDLVIALGRQAQRKKAQHEPGKGEAHRHSFRL